MKLVYSSKRREELLRAGEIASRENTIKSSRCFWPTTHYLTSTARFRSFLYLRSLLIKRARFDGEFLFAALKKEWDF
jgi:hypothetical protein